MTGTPQGQLSIMSPEFAQSRHDTTAMTGAPQGQLSIMSREFPKTTNYLRERLG
jgi:hypothetical protein